MSETVNTTTGEVVETETAGPDNMLALVKESERGVYNALSSMDSLDWRSLKPHQTALLLC